MAYFKSVEPCLRSTSLLQSYIGNVQDAKESIEKALLFGERSRGHLLTATNILLQSRKKTLAMDYLLEALAKDDDGYSDTQVLLLLYLVSDVSRDKRVKIHDFQQHLGQLTSADWHEIGKFCMAQGDMHLALLASKKASEMNLDNVEIWTTLAECYRIVGKNDRAIQAGATGLHCDPGNIKLRNYLSIWDNKMRVILKTETSRIATFQNRVRSFLHSKAASISDIKSQEKHEQNDSVKVLCSSKKNDKQISIDRIDKESNLIVKSQNNKEECALLAIQSTSRNFMVPTVIKETKECAVRVMQSIVRGFIVRKVKYLIAAKPIKPQQEIKEYAAMFIQSIVRGFVVRRIKYIDEIFPAKSQQEVEEYAAMFIQRIVRGFMLRRVLPRRYIRVRENVVERRILSLSHNRSSRVAIITPLKLYFDETAKIQWDQVKGILTNQTAAFKNILKKTTPTLIEVGYSGTELTVEDVEILLFEKNLKMLHLSNCPQLMGSNLCDMLRNHMLQFIHTLNLANLDLGNEMCRVLATALQANNQLENLSLEQNSISDQGLKALSVLSCSELNLNDNRISDGGMLDFCKRRSRFRKLYFRNNSITDSGALRVLSFVRIESAVLVFDLSGNFVSEHILFKIQKNCTSNLARRITQF